MRAAGCVPAVGVVPLCHGPWRVTRGRALPFVVQACVTRRSLRAGFVIRARPAMQRQNARAESGLAGGASHGRRVE
ncbi:hypothetical protein BVI2075_370020 [Burkholderia vietnamiensis]|nr:hypothetical protein BVI2075_370020 [Burkholderia vietnamiensis]